MSSGGLEEHASRAAIDTLDRWFVEHADSVFGYLARRLGRDVGLDATADVFRVALERFPSFDPTVGSPRAWLFGIANNLARRHWRTERRRLAALARESASVAVPALDPLLHVSDRLDASRDLDLVLDALAGLSFEDRDLVLLFAWEGLNYSELAAVFMIPVGTVKSRMHSIRRELRRTTQEVRDV